MSIGFQLKILREDLAVTFLEISKLHPEIVNIHPQYTNSMPLISRTENIYVHGVILT